MASWALKRKATYLSIFFGIVIFLIALPTFFIVYKTPTCTDGKQNQGERGIDCGGSCRALCASDALSPIVHWQQRFKVSKGLYNIVSYVENPNRISGTPSLAYVFRLYDDKNIVIAERKGRTMVPPRKIFPVFEGALLTGESVPVRSTFEFTEVPLWTKDIQDEPVLRISNQEVLNEETSPRLKAKIENISLKTISNIEVVATLFDATGNAIAASKTVVDRLEKESSVEVVFTWPLPFMVPVGKIDIIPKLYPGIQY